jgi:hypothetical protein
MKLSHYLSVVAIATIFASCSQQGATGPAGPTGPTGPAGTANINTQQYTVTTWNAATSSPVYTWISTWSEPDITDNNNDAVLCYWSTASSGWLSMPVTNLLGGNYGDELSFGYTNGFVTFTYYTGGTNTLPPSSYSGFTTIYFKVTVIPPSMQHRYPGTNWKNASEVAKIPEVQAALNSTK